MARFLYKAKNNQGEVVTGTVMAPNHFDAEQVLIKHNLVPTDIVLDHQISFFSRFFGRVSAKDKAVIARQLATMLSAGLPLAKAITILTKQAKNESQRKIFLEIYKDIEQGYSFSVALSRHPQAFDRVFVSIVNAGESTGKLDIVLKELANQLERDSSFNSKVKGSLAYPGFIFVAVIVAAFVMMVVVVPKLKTMFDSQSMSLPMTTKLLISTSDFVGAYWWLLVLLIIGVYMGFRFWIATYEGGRIFHRIEMKIPGLKTILEGLYMYRFTRILAMLSGAGVPLLDSLHIAGSVIDNPVYEASIRNVSVQIEKGVPLSVQLLKEPIFPQLIGNMVAVGEETGELDKVLDKVADYYEEATNDMVKIVTSLVEPAVLILVGLAVAFIVFAIYLPIYQLNSSAGS
ncbi:MAG: type II secretion system F family protein [Candidatus Berkelbacteria bacterium]|nr:type II secretion system F family protein [Candidatus Berkelbacteria bacterium]